MAGDLTDLGTDVSTIQDVVRVLGAIRDRSAQDVIAPKVDGISCFSRLYTVITQNVLDTVEGRAPARAFRDPDFLTKLDLEFARRYLTAIQAHEARDPTAPACWNVLFDRRRDQHIGHVNYAACGVDAHVNFDLAFALLETWKTFPPTPLRP
jgi:hypothetical protein